MATMTLKITCVERGSRFAVSSASGRQYEISYAGSGDADPEYVSLWRCDCTAGRYGRLCKHMRAFMNSVLIADDIIEGDAIEIDSDGHSHWQPAQ